MHPPGSWVESALCVGFDPELWFPDQGGITALARNVCKACPVMLECRIYSLEVSLEEGMGYYTLHGLWGGLTRKDRKTRRDIQIRLGEAQMMLDRRRANERV